MCVSVCVSVCGVCGVCGVCVCVCVSVFVSVFVFVFVSVFVSVCLCVCDVVSKVALAKLDAGCSMPLAMATLQFVAVALATTVGMPF